MMRKRIYPESDCNQQTEVDEWLPGGEMHPRDMIYNALCSGDDSDIPLVLKALILYYCKAAVEKPFDETKDWGEAFHSIPQEVAHAYRARPIECGKMLDKWTKEVIEQMKISGIEPGRGHEISGA